MRSIFGTLSFTVVFCCAAANQLPAIAQNAVVAQAPQIEAIATPPEADNMESLFNGTNLDGWEGDERLWAVTDGVIRGETTAEKKSKGNTFLIWKDEVTDFELRLSFRVSSINNSGIQYRSAHITDPAKKPRNDYVLRGYQHEIRNSGDLPDVAGFIYDEGGKRKRMCLVGDKAIWKDGKKIIQSTLISPEDFKKLFRVDQWNDVVIVAKGNRLQHYLNGRLILDFTDSEDQATLTGRIGLQLHGGKPMWAEYKDIRLSHLK
jgi:hypothetical protein